MRRVFVAGAIFLNIVIICAANNNNVYQENIQIGTFLPCFFA
jgi:hypothetical protein